MSHKTPEHYDSEVQPIDLIEAIGLDFAEGNVVKYVCRYKKKDGLRDLYKARDYLDLIIKRLEDRKIEVCA